MKDKLSQRNAAGFSAIVNVICAMIVFILGKNLFAIILAIFLLAWAIIAARKWIELGRS
jgi:ABC-type dipeptide/oligopeptide/nickel transport system permease subunit